LGISGTEKERRTGPRVVCETGKKSSSSPSIRKRRRDGLRVTFWKRGDEKRGREPWGEDGTFTTAASRGRGKKLQSISLTPTREGET